MKAKRQRPKKLKLRNCPSCHRLTDSSVCAKCGKRTFPNSYIKRFPRLPKSPRKKTPPDPFETPEMRKARRLEAHAVKKPYQGGLPS